MPVEKVTLFEERCDRCRALLATKKGEKVIERRAESAGPFRVEIKGKTVVSYDKVCPACMARLKRLVDGMGTIDRTRGGKRKG